MTRGELYILGVKAAEEFLLYNKLPLPVFRTYADDDIALCEPRIQTFFARATKEAALVGRRTGLYFTGHVFVNIPATAMPVVKPTFRSWSWPGWKTDRTAMGVVAHETGHHVGEVVSMRFTPEERAVKRSEWLAAIKGKKVSGYEPVPDEAAAETMRLFILNPELLWLAIPQRFKFILDLGLKPVPRLMKKGWREVLANDNYVAAAERWIAA